MAEIQFERRGFPLWKALLIALGVGAAAFGGYEAMNDDASPARPAAPAAAPAAGPAPAPSTAPAP
jgi:hypothetical protein